jgi:thiol-disulfide isomerase/thioredoxin
MKGILKLIFALLLITATSIFANAQLKSTPAQDFTLTDSYGVEANLFDTLASGKTVLLYFFSCDCIHCYEMAPIADSIYRQFGSGSNQLTVWGIAQYMYNNDDINEFIDSTHITFRCFGTGHEDDVFTMYDIAYTPQLMMICDYQASESIPQNVIVETLDYCFPTKLEVIHTGEFNALINNGILNIDSEKEVEEIYLYDLTGRLIYTDKNWVNSTFVSQIDPANLYILRVILSDGSSKSIKIQSR